MQTVPHVLNPADSAKAAEFARAIIEQANVADRCRIARYGMDIFQQYPIDLDAELEYLATLYFQPIDGLSEFFEALIDGRDDTRIATFENTIALNVHLLCTRQPLPEVEHV